MKNLFLALLLFGCAPVVTAQNVYDSVDEMPELIGGMAELVEHIRYPESARDAGIEGRVMVQFVVDETGVITSPSVFQSVHPDLDAAALAALEEVSFRPGVHEGEPAKVRMILPFSFVLPEEEHEAADVDEMPQIEGGMASLIDNIVYPDEAEEAGIEGRVIVSFVVDSRGRVQNVTVHEGVHPLIDAAAIEAVEKTSFMPGTRNGEPVAVHMAVPITFSLPVQE